MIQVPLIRVQGRARRAENRNIWFAPQQNHHGTSDGWAV